MESDSAHIPSWLPRLPGSSAGEAKPLPQSVTKIAASVRTNRVSWLAAIFLTIIATLMVTSSWDDSIVCDEFEHVTAGYSYLKTGDGWLNVWHPPLFKDIAAIPLLFANLHDPFQMACWQKHQKIRVVENLFFELGNDPQTIIRLARMPMILCALLFLTYYYFRIRREYGDAVGLTSLVLLGASPTFIAHSRFVHSDIAATAFFFIAICSFVDFLQKPSKSTFIKTAAFTSVALLAKASVVLVYPFYLLISLVWVLISYDRDKNENPFKKLCIRFSWFALAIQALIVIGALVVMAYYQPHIQHLSPGYQRFYNGLCFKTRKDAVLPQAVMAIDHNSVTRGLSWYLTGVVAQGYHVMCGHESPSNLLDEFYWGGKPVYFPILFMAKEPLGSLGMILLGLCISAYFLWKHRKSLKLIPLAREYFLAVTAVLFVLLYAGIAAIAQLNIGFRHFLPVVPFVYLTAGVIVVRGVSGMPGKASYLRVLSKSLPLLTILSALLAWPCYLSYYNEIAGTTDRGYLIALDSNYDWGVDLLRLKNYLRDHDEKVVYMCYYDYGYDKTYLGKVAKPVSFDQKFPPGQLVAVPASRWRKLVLDTRPDSLLISREKFPTIDNPEILRWFCALKPIGKVGESILLYKCP